ncbi:MAG: HAD hydrolase family protein [Parabacteroides sp.]|nr:HAD hydrolase family protein [Parabacteroides sp.]
MKALFFDVDGTLVDIKTHRVPESTQIALREAQKNRNKIFIATGRSHTILDLPGLPNDLIDGYVTLNGAVCLAGGTTVRLTKIPSDAVKTLSGICIQKNYTCLFVTMDGMIVANPDEKFRTGFQEYFNLGPIPVTGFEAMLHQDIYQMTVFFTEEVEKELSKI